MEATAGFGVGFGPTSKKPPLPNPGEVIFGGATDDRWLAVVLKLAKGSALGCDCIMGAGIGGDVGGLKFKSPNASPRPPILVCCWIGGDCMAPIEG